MRTLFQITVFVTGIMLYTHPAQAAQMTSAGYELSDSGTTNGSTSASSSSYQLRGALRTDDGSTGHGTLYVVRGDLAVIQPKASVILGDINGDGKVDIADAYRMLEIAVGRVQSTVDNLKMADVAPLVNGKPSPDGVIDVSDVVVVLRKIVGLVNF